MSLATAHTIFFYRALRQWSDDHLTRALADQALVEELEHFDWLQATYNDHASGARHTFWEAAVGTRSRQCRWRDETVRMAFEAAINGWSGRSVLACLTYDEFVSRLVSVICRTHASGFMRRLLLKPWMSGPKPVKVDSSPQVTPGARFALAA